MNAVENELRRDLRGTGDALIEASKSLERVRLAMLDAKEADKRGDVSGLRDALRRIGAIVGVEIDA